METILLVDDDTAVRSVSQLILEECGYQALAAEDGSKALRIAKNTPVPPTCSSPIWSCRE